MDKETSKKSWIQRNWSNLLFFVFILLFLIPSTRFQLQIFINRALSFSPKIENESKRSTLTDYNWQLVSQSGEKIQFSDAKDEVIFINVWASWCGPCVAEMPSLQALYDSYKKDVAFYFVAQDEKNAVEDFMKKNNYNLPVYYSQQNPPKVLQSNQLPTTYLIDKKGSIWINKTGVANWNSEKVNALIENLIAE